MSRFIKGGGRCGKIAPTAPLTGHRSSMPAAFPLRRSGAAH
ncbi:hypothetical protein BN2497_13331 [Janthinobacterium sp. CG23_2]|nr:hypothetical protein BN2497_13331 [Janthinobacterium sp. CG23_2]CUU33063.1 hypothetical protein BN3177_13331 [Janthinobacterium sp. CG23_2]